MAPWSVWAWVVFYALFMAYALNEHGGFLFVDSANLVVHEGGHLLFGWLGQTLGMWGGTILQWAGAAATGRIFFLRATTGGNCVLPIFLFRELALHSDVYGGCASHDSSLGDGGRSGHGRARLALDLFESGPAAIRHDDCGRDPSAWVVWDGWRGGVVCRGGDARAKIFNRRVRLRKAAEMTLGDEMPQPWVRPVQPVKSAEPSAS